VPVVHCIGVEIVKRPARLTSAATVAVAALLLAACGGGSSSGKSAGPAAKPVANSSQLAAPSPTAPVGGSAPAHPLSDASIRVANLYAPKDKPGPALDIYDTQLTGVAATPILSSVGYGTVSAYVHPNLLGTFPQKTVELWALPAGENPATSTANEDSKAIGGLIDDGSNAVMTIVVSADTGGIQIPGVLSGLQDSERVESGDDGQGEKGPAAPTPPAGKGELLVDTSVTPQTGSSGLYLMVDNSCTPPINGDPNVKGVPYVFAADSSSLKSQFALFPTTPGTHQVSVVSWTSDIQPTCHQLTKRQSTTSVTVTAGQQDLVFIYGPTLSDLHIVAAPIPQ
jgi:hypothetical protein